MYASPYCASCQTLLRRDQAVCPKCGAPRAVASKPESEPVPMGMEEIAAANPPGTPPYFGGVLDHVTKREIDRTKTGVALLAAGALFVWIPLIGWLGGLLELIGAILVILGREAFGDAHARNVGIAIGLFIIGFVGGLILAGGILSSIGQAVTLPPTLAQPAIVSAFGTYLLAALVLSVISGPASVLLLWELLGVPGKALILLSYVAGIMIALWVYLVITAQVAAALSSAFAVTPPDPTPILALDAQINSLRLLSAIPSLLSAGAAGMARSRIEYGEIPKHVA